MSIRYLILGFISCIPWSFTVTAAPAVQQPLECQLKSGEWAHCLSLDVPENRAKPSSPSIKIRVAVFKALAPTKDKAPIYLLAGGPGQAASEAFVPLPESFRRLRRHHDIILIDQRGTGESHPLRCVEKKDPKWLLSFDENFAKEHSRKCFESMRTHTDLAAYTTDAAAADMEAMRLALGHKKIIIFGVSYGTRLGLRYLALYPDAVEKQILEGVLPPDINVMKENDSFENSLRGVAALCRKDSGCQAYGDPWDHYKKIEAQWAARPRLGLNDPRSGEAKEATVRPELLETFVRPFLYSPTDMSILPKILKDAAAGHFNPLIAKAFADDYNVYDALYFLLMCAEDIGDMGPPLRESQKSLVETCSHLPKASLPADFRVQPVSQTPTLLLSGGLDPVTPPHYVTNLKKSLPQATHLILPDYGHNISYVSCIQDSMISFIEASSPPPPQPECLKQLRALHFFQEGSAR